MPSFILSGAPFFDHSGTKLGTYRLYLRILGTFECRMTTDSSARRINNVTRVPAYQQARWTVWKLSLPSQAAPHPHRIFLRSALESYDFEIVTPPAPRSRRPDAPASS